MTFSRAIIPLILFTLVLSFAAVALIINGALTIPTLKEISTSCIEQFATQQKKNTCPAIETPSIEIHTVAPTSTHPGFSYPSSWSLAETFTTLENGVRSMLNGEMGIVFYCDACDKSFPLHIVTEPLPSEFDSTKADAFIAEQYTHTVTNLVISKKKVVIGTEERAQYSITGINTELTQGPFTDIIFLGKNTWSKVTLSSEENFTPDNDAYKNLIASLDFSLIP